MSKAALHYFPDQIHPVAVHTLFTAAPPPPLLPPVPVCLDILAGAEQITVLQHLLCPLCSSSSCALHGVGELTLGTRKGCCTPDCPGAQWTTNVPGELWSHQHAGERGPCTQQVGLQSSYFIISNRKINEQLLWTHMPLSGQPFWSGKDCWFTGLGRNGTLSGCCCLPAAAPNCAILSRMWSKTLLTCGSLHGRAGDCSSVLGHSACVWLWGTGCWRGGCWVQQCPRFPLQKKRRYFSFYPCSPLPPMITTLSPLHPTDKALWNMTHF